MPRIVELKDQSPLLIRPEDTANGIVAVCRCGLSSNWPYCNGAHKATSGEEPGKMYHYDQQLPQGQPQRHEVDWQAIQDGFHSPATTEAASVAKDRVKDPAAEHQHGAGASPVRPPRPPPVHPEATTGKAPSGETPDQAPPEGPSQAI